MVFSHAKVQRTREGVYDALGEGTAARRPKQLR